MAIIKTTRLQNNYSLRQFAEALGVSHTQVSLFESGVATPTVAQMHEWLNSDQEWLSEMAKQLLPHAWNASLDAMKVPV